MKRLLLFLSILILTMISTQVYALKINIYDSVEGLNILEDFEDVDTGWYQTLDSTLGSNVGIFTAGGSKGTGATSYDANNGPDSPDPYFSVQNTSDYSGGTWYGRTNTTAGGSQWLDSGDITQLTLDVADYIGNTYNSLYFYMLDPSDCGATTTVNGVTTETKFINFSGEGNGDRFLVGITWEDGEVLDSITWTVSTQGDGYGLDDFATAPVPEPATMMLFGIGLLGLAGVARRKK